MTTEYRLAGSFQIDNPRSNFNGLKYRVIVTGERVYRAFDAEVVLRRVGEQERAEEARMAKRRKYDETGVGFIYPIGYSPRLSNGKLG